MSTAFKFKLLQGVKPISKGPKFCNKAGGEANIPRETCNLVPLVISKNAATSSSAWISKSWTISVELNPPWLGLFPSNLHHYLVAHACRIKNVVLEFRSSEDNILVNVNLSRTISKDNIVSMLPYTPNRKRKNNLPWRLMPQLVGLTVFLHPKMKVTS